MSKYKSKRQVSPRSVSIAHKRVLVDTSLGYEIMSWMVRLCLWMAIASYLVLTLTGCSKTGYENHPSKRAVSNPANYKCVVAGVEVRAKDVNYGNSGVMRIRKMNGKKVYCGPGAECVCEEL